LLERIPLEWEGQRDQLEIRDRSSASALRPAARVVAIAGKLG
jgi:hypothetical protein